MSRGEKYRKVGLMGALIGLLITAGLVVALFSLLPHSVLQGEWPLNISSSEVMKYAEVADVRRVEQQLKEPQGEVFIIGASPTDDCLYDRKSALWEWRWFEAQGFGDSAMIRATTTIDGGYEIRFKEMAPFRGQEGILVSPARPEDIRMKYAEVIATGLGLATPAISFVRVVACGREQRAHVVEEVMGEGFLGRRRFTETILFKDSFDPDRSDRIFPEVIGDTAHSSTLRSMLALLAEDAESERLDRMAHALDDRAAAGWLLMHWLEGAPEPLQQENYFAFQWNRGRTIPLHRASRSHAAIDTVGSNAEIGFNVFTPWVKVPAFQETFKEVRDELLGKRATLEEGFTAVDSTWLPVLANDAPFAEVKEIADRIKQQIFDRLEHGDALAFFDRPMVRPAGHATLMKGQEVAKRYWPTESDIDVVRSIAQKYKGRIHGDSIVLPRGKYFIDEDLILPKGYGLILLSGARITMAPDRNILVQGPLHIRGSRLNPVFIRPGGGAFGTIAVFGDGETKCTVDGLQISGGRGARINGVQHPAMLSIQDVASTRSKDCIFSAPAGDLALFIQGGDVEMDGNVMLSSPLELRDVNGSIRKCNFQNTRGANGLVLNASRIDVEESNFGSIGGAAIEANDGSKVLVRGSQIGQCGVAIAATDLAQVHVSENTIQGNRTAFSAKRIKPAYGGAKIFVYSNELQRNGNERDADEHSSITNADRFDERVMEEEVP